MGDFERFVGVWELEAILEVSEENDRGNFLEGNRAGEVAVPAAGFEQPLGLLLYLPTGEMSVHFAGTSRIPFLREFSPSPSELVSAGAAYGGYAGRWELDEKRHEVLHHVKVAFIPNRTGTTIRRSYSFEEISGSPGSLVLCLRPIALSPSEDAPRRVLRWRRPTAPTP